MVSCPAPLTVQVPYAATLPAPAVVTVNGVAQYLMPVDGHLGISFPAGVSTAFYAVQ